ncbi:MAG: PD40 domain-containing protein [Candidatus Aminicenantes bacterium]|nr:MAG: PD40 domain-containing protein [Candidatus Aminicenantes bacterium]
MRKSFFYLFLFFAMVWLVLPAFSEEARLLRQPTISKDHVAFVYANDIWIVSRTGGNARRVTTHVGTEAVPRFSPDGKHIAFSGQYDGNTDVFILPTEGGEPKRLTYHPYGDTVRGWTPDGKYIIFASGRDTAPGRFPRLWKISTKGGMPEPLPMPMANKGAYSPDSNQMAYVRLIEAFGAWRHYRGGRTTAVWLIDLSDYSIEKVPRDNSNDTDPMWIKDTVYFISDRNHTMNLFSYQTTSKTVKQLTFHEDFDIKSASACGDAIAYEQAGYLYVFDPQMGKSTQINVEIRADLPGRRAHFANVSRLIRSGDISPTGVRAVFEARGDIITVPAKKGDYRNLTTSSNANDRSPTWSPDGKKIAWFSDKSGEYQLMIVDQKGEQPARSIALENPSFYYAPVWSPDSKKIAFADKRLNLWYIDLESGKTTKIDKDTYDHPYRSLDHNWSPDSNWITYSKRLDNHMHAIFVFSLKQGKSYQITDGLSDSISPAFDRGGKYLYFLASTDFALNTGWLDMTSYDRPVTRGVYLAVLNAKDPSPLLPESDEEEVEKEEEKAKKKEKIKSKAKEKPKPKPKAKDEAPKVRIDIKNIDQRVLALDIPLRNYSQLKTGAEGVFFYAESIQNQRGFVLHRYDLKKRETKPFMSGIFGYSISANSKKLLYSARNMFGIVETAGKAKVGDGRLNTSDLRIRVNPIAEWNQIYHEGWRINRDFLYDAKMHGADWDAIYKKYKPFLAHVAHRSDLSYILSNLIGELTIGHSRAGGGVLPRVETVPVGLLGADYEVEDGYYKFAKIYTGENWNPGLQAPLTAPGLNASEGDYLLEVNGIELKAPTNIYKLFEATAGKQTTLRINSRPSHEGSQLITVVPVRSETGLRGLDWIEGNRRKVDKMSNGRLAYVYLPNTSRSGYINFNRYYFAQQDKEGAVIDERFNGGGSAAGYFVDMMTRPLVNYFATRDGKVCTTPMAQIFGPKVMIINEYAGSGGDLLPYIFRFRKAGLLIGKRTWGGLVGHHGGVGLIDGGSISSPNLAFYSIEGVWDVENVGVAPDIEIEMTPAMVIKGQDPQLERAVKEALRLLEEKPFKHTPRPAPIDRVSKKKK